MRSLLIPISSCRKSGVTAQTQNQFNKFQLCYFAGGRPVHPTGFFTFMGNELADCMANHRRLDENRLDSYEVRALDFGIHRFGIVG
jgi:hypothetical protein